MRAELEAAHGDPQPVEIDGRTIPGCYRVSSGRVLQDGRIKRMLNQGKLFVSDAASQEVARLVLPATLPQSFLEIGAGRGTKTLLLQSGALRVYGRQMPGYVTVDNHDFKTRLLRERAEAFGHPRWRKPARRTRRSWTRPSPAACSTSCSSTPLSGLARCAAIRKPAGV